MGSIFLICSICSKCIDCLFLDLRFSITLFSILKLSIKPLLFPPRYLLFYTYSDLTRPLILSWSNLYTFVDFYYSNYTLRCYCIIYPDHNCFISFLQLISYTCCVVYFVLCLVYPMLLVSLDCPFLIVPSVFSSVYLHILCCVFRFVCLRPVSCVPNVACFSGLSILDCHFGFL